MTKKAKIYTGLKIVYSFFTEDGGEIVRTEVHFFSARVKCLADLRNRVNSQRYSRMYEDQRPKIVQDIKKSDGKKNA